MIVDDEADILTVLEKGLDTNGFKVIGFSDPLTALQHFENNRKNIDLIITDARMPKMSGFQLARRIKDLEPDVHVILVSAFEINKTEFDKVMPHTHVDGFLAKPFLVSDLVGAIKALD